MLPIFVFREGATEAYRSGQGFTNLNDLLRKLHEGVMELGVGCCEVRVKDNPMARTMGFELSQTGPDGLFRGWIFDCNIRVWKESVTANVMASVEGRARIALLLQEGKTPEQLEQALNGSP